MLLPPLSLIYTFHNVYRRQVTEYEVLLLVNNEYDNVRDAPPINWYKIVLLPRYDWQHCALQLRMNIRINLLVSKIKLYMRRYIIRKHDFFIMAERNRGRYAIQIYDVVVRYSRSLSDSFMFPSKHNSVTINDSVLKGGYAKVRDTLPGRSISDFVISPHDVKIEASQEYLFVSYIDRAMLGAEMAKSPHYVATQIPLNILVRCLTLGDLAIVGKIHGIKKSSRLNKEQNLAKFAHHYCPNCKDCYAIFEPVKVSEEKCKELIRMKAKERRMDKLNKTGKAKAIPHRKANLYSLQHFLPIHRAQSYCTILSQDFVKTRAHQRLKKLDVPYVAN